MRQHRLRRGKCHGEREGEMAEFWDHPPVRPVGAAWLIASTGLNFDLSHHVAAGGGWPAAEFQWPDFFSAATTSFGM